MKKFKRVLFYLLLLFLILNTGLNAEKIGLLSFKSVGIESNITEAVSQLIEYELNSYGHTVLRKDKIEDKTGKVVECCSKKCATEVGTQLGLKKVIFGSLTKIGEKYIVLAKVVESETGKIVFSDRITAATPEDLDVCLSRLVKTMEKGTRIKTTSLSIGGGLGMGTPVMNYSVTQSNFLIYYEVKTWYETPKFAVEVDWYNGSSDFEHDPYVLGEWALGISLIYFFATSDLSPYLVMGVANKNISIDQHELSSELALDIGGGLVLFRTKIFRLVLDGRLSTAFNEIGMILQNPHSSLKIGVNLLYKQKLY